MVALVGYPRPEIFDHLAYSWYPQSDDTVLMSIVIPKMGMKKLNKLDILKIKDLKTTNRDRKKSNQTRLKILCNMFNH